MSALLSIAPSGSHAVAMPTGIGAYIKSKRAELGLNQTELAERAEMTRSHLAVIESGKVNLPNADLRRRIARALGVSHLDILVAAGEITRDELQEDGIIGTVEPDPVRAELIASLNRLPLTGDRPAAIRGLIDVYADIDRRTAEARESVDTQGNGGDITGID